MNHPDLILYERICATGQKRKSKSSNDVYISPLNTDKSHAQAACEVTDLVRQVGSTLNLKKKSLELSWAKTGVLKYRCPCWIHLQ